MENKYKELEKLNQLKANGTITENEFEVEKQKILNSKHTKIKVNRKLSRLFLFIMTLFAVITIILVIIHFKSENESRNDTGDISDILSAKSDAEMDYNSRRITYSQYQKRLEEIDEEFFSKPSEEQKTTDMFMYISGGITIVFLITSVIFIIIEKKENR